MWLVDSLCLDSGTQIPCIFYENQLTIDFGGLSIGLKCLETGEIKTMRVTKGMKYVVDSELHDKMPYGYVPLHRYKRNGAVAGTSMAGALVCIDAQAFEFLEFVDRIVPVRNPPTEWMSRRNAPIYGIRVLDAERSLFDFEFKSRWNKNPDDYDRLIMASPLLHMVVSCPGGWVGDRYYFRASEAADELSYRFEVPDSKFFCVSFVDVVKARALAGKVATFDGDKMMDGIRVMKKLYNRMYGVYL